SDAPRSPGQDRRLTPRRQRAPRAEPACASVHDRPHCCPDGSPDQPRSRYLARSRPTASARLRPSQMRGAFHVPRSPTPSNPAEDEGTEMKLTGAQALIKSLEMEGTEVMFG